MNLKNSCDNLFLPVNKKVATEREKMTQKDKERCEKLIASFSPYLNEHGYFVTGDERIGYVIVGDRDESGFSVQIPCGDTAEKLETELKEQYALHRMIEITAELPEEEQDKRQTMAVKLSNPYFALTKEEQDIVFAEITKLVSAADISVD